MVSLDPVNKFVLEQFLEPSEMERMRRVTVERILSMTSLARQIILMQLHYFSTKGQSRVAYLVPRSNFCPLKFRRAEAGR